MTVRKRGFTHSLPVINLMTQSEAYCHLVRMGNNLRLIPDEFLSEIEGVFHRDVKVKLED